MVFPLAGISLGIWSLIAALALRSKVPLATEQLKFDARFTAAFSTALEGFLAFTEVLRICCTGRISEFYWCPEF